MNRVAIYGGLGNQMFQYALAISMDAEGIPTKISIKDFLIHKHYQGFELTKAFNVPLPMLDKAKILLLKKSRPILMNRINNGVLKLFLNGVDKATKNIYKEKNEYHFDENVFKQESSLLIGTWQSEQYFSSQKQLIKEVFSFNKPTDSQNIKISAEIQSGNSVAVHIRRGDFMNPDHIDSRLVIDSMDYYSKAIMTIKEKVDNPVFYIFSDDIEWAKSNFRGNNYRIVSHNKDSDSFYDMYLMSICKHFIIANSAFSWWAAWLAHNKNKVVIMPKPWIKETDCPSIYPEDWITLSVKKENLELVSQ